MALPTFGGLGLAEGSARAMVGVRVNQEDDIESLDVTAHGERSFMLQTPPCATNKDAGGLGPPAFFRGVGPARSSRR